MRDMILGITTGSFWPKSTKEALHSISKLGFKRVEFNLQRSEFGYGFEKRFNLSFYKEMKELIRELSLEVVTIHVLDLSGAQVFSEGIRKSILMKSIEIANLLGAEVLVVHPEYIFRGYEDAINFLSMPNERFLIKGFSHLATVAKDYGVILGIENIQMWHDFPLLNDTENILKLIDFIGTVGFVLDIFHSELADNTRDFIDKVGQSIINVHISDTDDRKKRMLPGEGNTDWEEVILSLDKVNYNRCLMMELYHNFTTPQLLSSKRFIEGIIYERLCAREN